MLKKNRIKQENQRIKEWEIKFDEEQRKKEEESLKKFKERENAHNQDMKKEFSNEDTH